MLTNENRKLQGCQKYLHTWQICFKKINGTYSYFKFIVKACSFNGIFISSAVVTQPSTQKAYSMMKQLNFKQKK